MTPRWSGVAFETPLINNKQCIPEPQHTRRRSCSQAFVIEHALSGVTSNPPPPPTPTQGSKPETPLTPPLPPQAFRIEHEGREPEFVGNRTECALLILLRSWGGSYAKMREARVFGGALALAGARADPGAPGPGDGGDALVWWQCVHFVKGMKQPEG